jgi:hypothetical protein
MRKNVGGTERFLRLIAAMGFFTCSVMAPLPWAVRVATFGVLGCYMVLTAISARCLGYRLLGRSTCPLEPKP